MRHARHAQQLSRPTSARQALLAVMSKNVLRHGRIRTTPAKARAARRVVDRLIGFGKDGSVHSRRQAYRVLQDRDLVKQLFAEVAPRFLDCHGGYTRVLKLGYRPGDGAAQVLLELTRLPVAIPVSPPRAKAKLGPPAPTPEAQPVKPKAAAQAPKPKRFLEGLRDWFRPKKGDRQSSSRV